MQNAKAYMTHGVAQVSLPQIVCQQFIFARRAGFVVGQFESQLRGWKGLGNVFRCADAECDRGSSLKLMRLLWRGSIDVHCQRRFWHKWLSDPTFWRREWERVDSEKSTESCGHSLLLCIAAYRRWVVRLHVECRGPWVPNTGAWNTILADAPRSQATALHLFYLCGTLDQVAVMTGTKNTAGVLKLQV